ncbi:MAG: glucose-1-phosphate adenylyltransferase [Christensenellales bacterium]
MGRKKCVAMLLAGGQGSRLGVLTEKIAKPAVPFGGKYRIIDFTLSNCANSNIDTVGVLTQYQPLELNSYIGNGQPWDLDRNNGGVYVLPPYLKGSKGEWYKGTANAIYQNIGFIEQFEPQYVIVLSGDHIYKMNYAEMIQFHESRQADATIAVIEVPAQEASRFGIINTNADNRVLDFEEKPKNPKSNKASMGVYVFSWKALKEFLFKDEADTSSANDFGKNIIPLMLRSGCNIRAFPFNGYWKDVGTIYSLWESNMDLISSPPRFDLHDPQWRVYSRNRGLPPHYIDKAAVADNCLITEGCQIYGAIENSVLFSGVTVKEGARICDSVIMPGVVIEENTKVYKAIIGENTVIQKNCIIGDNPVSVGMMHAVQNDGITVIAGGCTIVQGSSVPVGDMYWGQEGKKHD